MPTHVLHKIAVICLLFFNDFQYKGQNQFYDIQGSCPPLRLNSFLSFLLHASPVPALLFFECCASWKLEDFARAIPCVRNAFPHMPASHHRAPSSSRRFPSSFWYQPPWEGLLHNMPSHHSWPPITCEQNMTKWRHFCDTKVAVEFIFGGIQLLRFGKILKWTFRVLERWSPWPRREGLRQRHRVAL